MKNLDSVLKSRDITLLTKVCEVQAMDFLAVMYGCESTEELVLSNTVLKTLENPLDSKIKPVKPKGIQP